MAGKDEIGEIIRFVNGLGDEYIIQWANRGLFRRGGKLADQAAGDAFEMDDDRITAHLGGCTQSISGPDLKLVVCDCPAASICHHLTAFLIALRRGASELGDVGEDPGVEAEASTARPWLIADPGGQRKAFGKSVLKRARVMMLHAVPVRLTEDDGGLVAVIDDKKEFTVRIPRNGGLEASLCSCKSGRCVHRALAVLAALAKEGVLRLEDIEEEHLTGRRKQVVLQMETWLKSLLFHGLGSATKSHQEQGETLATLARQADLPKFGSRISGLCQWIADHRKRASLLRVDSARHQIARLSAALIALKKRPPPRPMRQLAGEHARYYRVIRNLDLIGTGVECWESPTGYSGFTMYLYAPDQEEWFMHTQARPSSFSEQYNWEPEEEFLIHRLADGPAARSIPGAQIRLLKGWLSADNRLSGREGVRVEERPLSREGVEKAVFTDFSALAEAYGSFHSKSLFSNGAFMPAMIHPAGFDNPKVDAGGSVWRQIARDGRGRRTILRIDADRYSKKRVGKLEKSTLSPGNDAIRIFGVASLDRGVLTIRPISVAEQTPFVWNHLTL